MVVYGKEYKFALTVRAQQRMADLCPDGNIKSLDSLFSTEGFTAKDMELSAQLIVILSEAYETKACFEDLEHKYDPITMDIVLSLDWDEFQALQTEAQACYKRDKAPTVMTEPQKKTAAEDPGSSSAQAGTSTTAGASA